MPLHARGARQARHGGGAGSRTRVRICFAGASTCVAGVLLHPEPSPSAGRTRSYSTFGFALPAVDIGGAIPSGFILRPGAQELSGGSSFRPVFRRRERTRYRSRLCFFRWIYEVAEPSTRDLLRSSPPSKPLRPLMMMSKNCIEALYASTAQRLGTGPISVKHILAPGADSTRSYA